MLDYHGQDPLSMVGAAAVLYIDGESARKQKGGGETQRA